MTAQLIFLEHCFHSNEVQARGAICVLWHEKKKSTVPVRYKHGTWCMLHVAGVNIYHAPCSYALLQCTPTVQRTNSAPHSSRNQQTDSYCCKFSMCRSGVPLESWFCRMSRRSKELQLRNWRHNICAPAASMLFVLRLRYLQQNITLHGALISPWLPFLQSAFDILFNMGSAVMLGTVIHTAWTEGAYLSWLFPYIMLATTSQPLPRRLLCCRSRSSRAGMRSSPCSIPCRTFAACLLHQSTPCMIARTAARMYGSFTVGAPSIIHMRTSTISHCCTS